MRRVLPLAAAALAATALSACGSGLAAVSQVSADQTGTLLYVAGAPSHGLGVDNTDLLAATTDGHVRDLTSTDAAERDAAWSPDGSRVVFVRYATTGHENGAIAFSSGVYTWSPGNGAPQRIATCPDTGCTQSEFAWSPDDRQIAFLAASPNSAIDVMSADGSGVHTVCAVKRCGPYLDSPRWSPDGSTLVFSNQGNIAGFSGPHGVTGGTAFNGGDSGATGGAGPGVPISNIWIAKPDGSDVKHLTQPDSCKAGQAGVEPCAADAAPTWSPDGTHIAFTRNGLFEVVNADGSDIRRLATCVVCDLTHGPVWTPDGQAIAYGANDAVRITTLDGKTTVLRTCGGSGCLSPTQLTWSPSGAQVAFFAGGSPTQGNIWAIGRDGKGLHRISTGANSCCLAWVGSVPAGGKPIPRIPAAGPLHLSGTIAFDAPNEGLELLSLGPGTRHEFRVTPIGGLAPTWSPDGREIAYAGPFRPQAGYNIYIADRNGKNARLLTRFENGAGMPSWSPDGSTIAFNGSDRTYPYGIWLVPAAGGEPRRVTTEESINQSWSADGNELLFARGPNPNADSGPVTELYTIRTDGTGLQRVTNLPGNQDSAAWSPDGKWIVFNWTTPFGNADYLIHPDGTGLRRLTPLAAGGMAWSPDSRYIAGIDPHTWRLQVIDVKTGRVATVAIMPDSAGDLAWSSR